MVCGTGFNGGPQKSYEDSRKNKEVRVVFDSRDDILKT